MLSDQLAQLNEILKPYGLSTQTCDILEQSVLKLAGIDKKCHASFAYDDTQGVSILYQKLTSDEITLLIQFLQKYDVTAQYLGCRWEADYFFINAHFFSKYIMTKVLHEVETFLKDETFLLLCKATNEIPLVLLTQAVIDAISNLRDELLMVVKAAPPAVTGQFFQTIDYTSMALAEKYITRLDHLLATETNFKNLPSIAIAFKVANEQFIKDKNLINLPEYKALCESMEKLEHAYERYNPNWQQEALMNFGKSKFSYGK